MKAYHQKWSNLKLLKKEDREKAQKLDPSVFAYYHLRDQQGMPLIVDPYQDLILNDANTRVAVCISRQVGKTTLSIIKALHFIFFNPRTTVLVISQTKDQAKEVLAKMRDLLMSGPMASAWKGMMVTGGDSKEEFAIECPYGGVSRIVSKSAETARGFSAHGVIADEIALWQNPDERFNQAVMPTLSATKGWLLMLSTPKGKQGPLWVAALNQTDWSFYHFNWRICPRHDDTFMEQEQRRIGQFAFKQEYEAMFTVNQAAYFDEEHVKQCIRELQNQHTSTLNVVCGIDFGKKLDPTVAYFGVMERKENGKECIRVINRRAWPLNTPYSEIIDDIQKMSQLLNVTQIFYDMTGVGLAVQEFMNDFAMPCEGITFTLKTKKDMMSNLQMLFEREEILIPNEPKLIDELLLFEYEYTTSGQLKLHHPQGGHDDEVDALALMAWGLKRPGYALPSMKELVDIQREEEDDDFAKYTTPNYTYDSFYMR